MEFKNSIELFVDKNAQYYTNVWKTKSNNYSNKLFLSFNPTAILFGAFWFFYRKMYLIGIIQILTLWSTTVLTKYSLIVQIAILITFGLLADYLYLVDATRKISKCSNEEELKQVGGINTKLVIVLAILFIAVNIFYFIKALP